MDQLPHSRPEGFSNNALFAGSEQQFNAYNNLSLSAGADQSSYEQDWGVNTSNYGLSQSRAQAHSPSWPSHSNVNHSLHGHIGNVNGQPSPYARSVPQSPAPYGQHGYNGYNQAQHFQYQQSQPQYDPALFQTSHGQNFNYSTSNYHTPSTGTIAPQALQHDARSPPFGDRPNFPAPPAQARSGSITNNVVDQKSLIAGIPAGADAGLFTIINFDNLAQTTHTSRMGNFANIGLESMNWDCNRATLPAYVRRRSRNELRRAAGSDSRLLAKIGKKSTKMQRIAAAPKTLHAAQIASAQPSEKIKYEGETSSDESSSDDDDESSYTSEDEPEPAPLPAKRPESATGGTEYDTIKALWRSKRKSLSSDSIRKGLVDFWELAKDIRDRWKADNNAFEEAKKKGQKSQLPLLESRVKDARNMIEVAFKAALKHGHKSIVQIMSENESLIYLCYQFLLDRFKAEDYNGPIPRTMLDLMTSWTSLTEERMERTHIGKVLARYAKHGDAKTKYYANKITSNAATATKEAKENAASAQEKKSTSTAVKAGSPPQRHAEPVAGVKRPASATGEGTAAKRVATGSTKTNGIAARPSGAVKKTSATADAAKTSTAAPATVTKTKSVVAKPSGIFSSLSAAKKPGTSNANKATATGASTASKLAEKKATTAAPKSTFSFAETMANLAKPKEEKPAQPKPEKQLPPETAEQKARRLRKESRRHLRVSFKREDELTEVRYFTHDPDEELGHDASQMRDVSDVGGEGRMFKQQHQMMDMEDDEDTAERDEKSLVTFKEPGPINFKDIDADERARNYYHRGGGKLEVESKERADRDYYDANNLIVFYTTPEDIPPNPREPSNPYSGENVENVRDFASPPDKYATRARQKRTAQASQFPSQQQYPQQNVAAPQFDLSKLGGLVNQPPNMQQAGPPAPDIDSILASLKLPTANMPTQAPPQMTSFPPNFQAPPMMPGIQPPPPQQQAAPMVPPNLADILAQIGNNPAAPPPAMGGGSGGYGMPGAPNMAGFGQPPYTYTPNAGNWQGQGQSGGDNANRMTRETRNNPVQNPKYKTKVCQFWQKGTCQKGEGCSYKHSNE